MPKHNAANERVKQDYFEYLREAKRLSTPSIDAAAKAISRFEESTGWRDLRSFHIKQTIAFKAKLSRQASRRTGEPLSKATLYSTLQALRAFTLWLVGRPGFKSRIRYSDAEYFNLSEKEARIAKTPREKSVPTLDQIHHMLALMPSATDIERRDRALIAFAALTGARDGALASLRLKHVDIEDGSILQDGREVRTKFSKTFRTWFLPIGGDAADIAGAWVQHLRETLLWSDDDPLFPATRVEVGSDRRFHAAGLERRCWSSAAPIRRIYREAFERAGLPYFNPHSFRDMLVHLGQTKCEGSTEALKAWSQNLGHESLLTTLLSYGPVSATRQAAILRELGSSENCDPLDDPEVRDLLRRLARRAA
jgi:integrase